MVAENLHLEKYRHNKKILEEPAINKIHSDWAITIAFYCALHLIEKTIARSEHKKHEVKHKERNVRVRVDKDLKPIAEDYLFLYIKCPPCQDTKKRKHN